MSDIPDPPGRHTNFPNINEGGRYSPSKLVGTLAAMEDADHPVLPSTPSDTTPRGTLKRLPILEPAQWGPLATTTDIDHLHTTAVTTLTPSPMVTEGEIAYLHTTAPVSLTPSLENANDEQVTHFHNAAQAAMFEHVHPDEINQLHTTAIVSLTPSPPKAPPSDNHYTDAQAPTTPTPEVMVPEASIVSSTSSLSYASITESETKLTVKPEEITLPLPLMVPELSIETILTFQDKPQYNENGVPPLEDRASTPWGWEDDPNSRESRILTPDDPLPTITDPYTEHDFMQMTRMRSLPGTTLQGLHFPTPEVTQGLLEAATHFQRKLSDDAMGFGYYYPVPGFQLRPDSNLQITSDEVNASTMTTTVLLDTGLSKDAINVTQRGLTNTSWFRLAHTLMGSIIRGAMRSPAFRKLGRNSLNHVADHHFSPPGGPRPLTHLQLMQAMAHQLSRICDTNPENEQFQPTNMYDTTLRHLADQIHNVLKEQAREGITQEDRDAARLRALQELDQEYERTLRQDPETQDILEKRALERITDMLVAESSAVTEDWRQLWDEGYRAAILDEPFPGPNHVSPSTRLMKTVEDNAITMITDKLAELRDELRQEVRRNILINEKDRIYSDAVNIYNKQVDDEVKVLEGVLREDRKVEIEKRTEAVEARLNEEIEQDFQTWKTAELNKMKEAFMPGLEVAAHEHVLVLVRSAASKLGYDLIPKPTSQPAITSREQHPTAPSNEDIVMGTTEHTRPTLTTPTEDPRKKTPPSETVAAAKAPSADALVSALDKKADEVTERKKKANQGLNASMHAPANQMEVEPEPAPAIATDPILIMILDRIKVLTDTVAQVVDRVQNVEQTAEGKRRPPQGATTHTVLQSPPTVSASERKGEKTEVASRNEAPGVVKDPVAAAPKQSEAYSKEAFPPLGGGMAQAPGKGKGRVEPRQPKPKPTVTADGWVVTARANVVKDQNNVAAYANTINKNLGRTAMGRQGKTAPKRNTTEITVVRNGGVNDEAAERAIRNQNPSAIVMAVRSAIAKLTAQPIQVLSGRWATGFKAGTFKPTGNFVYTFNGVLNYNQIKPFEQELIKPLGRGALTPTHGWVWAQLRNVPTTDGNGVVYGPEELTNEIINHPAFEGATLCMPARWHGSIPSIMGRPTATVLIVYIDETGEQTSQIQHTGVHMFGTPTPFHIVGDQARFVQCQRCHNLGHEAGAKECKLQPGKFRCYKCGGDHHTEQHDFYCKGKHAIAGKCNCLVKCILCGKGGHHARSRTCPKRGEFGVAPPVPLTEPGNSQEDTKTPLNTSSEPGLVPTQREEAKRKRQSKGKGKAKGKDKTTTQQAPFDNSFSTLDENYGHTPSYKDIPEARVDEVLETPNTNVTQDVADTLAAVTTVPAEQRFELRTDAIIIPVNSLPGVSDLERAYNDRLGTGAEANDEAEFGWEGLLGGRDESYQPLARYALQQGWPLTRADTRAKVTEGLEPYQIGEALMTLDRKLGGDGSGKHITPAAYAKDKIDGRIFFARYELPKTPEEALKEVEEGVIFTNQIIADYDIQLGGDGQGSNFWSAIPETLWDEFPKALDIIRRYRTPPQSSTANGKTIAIANTYSLQTWRAEKRGGHVPGILALHHIIQNYLDEYSWSAGMMTAETARLIGDKHTPFQPIVKGLPGIFHKHRDVIVALRAWNKKIDEEGL